MSSPGRVLTLVVLVCALAVTTLVASGSAAASSPLTLVWGDVDCSGQANPVDTLALLRSDAGLAVTKAHPSCPGIGSSVAFTQASPAGQLVWGDVDCGGDVSPIDAVKVLRADAALHVDQAAGCPAIGSDVGEIGCPEGGCPTDWEALAAHWAPVIYQDTAAWDYDADYITAFDFDGNWNGLDNWANQPLYPANAYVYYWVVETKTNWFIGYAVFHPRDWEEVCFIFACHENDLEGVLLTIQRDGSAFGRFLMMTTIFHEETPSYRDIHASPSSNVSGPFEGDVEFAGGHPIIYIQAKGHGITGDERWEDTGFPGGDGVVYSYDGVAQQPPGGNATGVSYDLADIQPLWSWRCDAQTFASYGSFAGDNWTANAAHAPWGWDAWGYQHPVYFLAPATGIGDSFGNMGPFTRWDDGVDNDGDTIIDEADEGYTAASFTPAPLTAPFNC